VAERGWEQGLLAPETSALPAAGGWQVTGGKALVLDGLTADLFLVTARTLRGVALFAVDGDAAGIERVAEPALDLTRKQARVTFARTPARLVGREGGAEPGLVRAWDVMLAALAAEQVGGAQRCLEMIVEYLKVRVQFGRLLGSFQALKHRCANLVVEIDSARALAGAAAVAADEEDWPRLATLAALAKADCSEVFAHASAENVQLHGGIGFTWEHDAHLYFKRARASQYLFGEPSRYRERAAVSMGL
jgi:alkylation response protein AidB-like acyl-CoA dehydrogenase